MNIYLIILPFCLFFCYGCNKHKNEYKTRVFKVDSIYTSITNDKIIKESPFHSFWGIDSIVKSNYIFDDEIDSISISRHVFKAIYLSSHKGGVITEWYDLLRSSHPSEYESIVKVHTAHLLLIGDKIFSFNGKGEVKTPKEIPESTDVVIKASVYSFYSKGICLGRHVILDSIKLRTGFLDKR